MKGQTAKTLRNFEGAMLLQSREEMLLCNSVLNDEQNHEIKEIDKHEIIVKIADLLGPSPENLCRAEEIFNQIRFDLANFVLHHEYKSSSGVHSDLVMWLDEKTNPGNMKKLTDFFENLFG